MCWQNTTECVKIKLVHRSEQVNKKSTLKSKQKIPLTNKPSGSFYSYQNEFKKWAKAQTQKKCKIKCFYLIKIRSLSF